jgi:hypothetical protein
VKIRKQAEQNPELLKGTKVVFTPRQEELVRELGERLRQKRELDGAPSLGLTPEGITEALQEYIKMRNEAGEDWQGDY